jgi:hypothetical protein
MYELQGNQFGRLTVLHEVEPERVRERVHRRWRCQCECGNEKTLYQQNLLQGLSKSCGCLRREKSSERRKTHGASETPEYAIWLNMHQRCRHAGRNPRYAGRGIRVCPRWDSFENFLADMGPRPPNVRAGKRAEYSIERKDNDGNYEPDNCVWATQARQHRNKRTTRSITAHGRTLTLTDWSRETGVPITTIWNRLNAGWSAERSVTPNNY